MKILKTYFRAKKKLAELKKDNLRIADEQKTARNEAYQKLWHAERENTININLLNELLK